jgi:REP element-mobilizing transposase RayT
MPYRKTCFVPGENYHLYNRGNNFDEIFRNREDYLRFLRLVRKYLVDGGESSVLAYCLMPNHYHLLVHLLDPHLSAAMQRLGLAYTKVSNGRYGRVGRVFQSPFHAIHVGEERYLSALIAYIHRNPSDAGLVRDPRDWEFSSYRDYAGLRDGTLVDRSALDPLELVRAMDLSRSLPDRDRASIVGFTAD